MESNDDLRSLLRDHRRQLTAGEMFHSDLDLAFHLQLQEALSASLADFPSSSSPPPLPKDDGVSSLTVANEQLSRLDQEILDRDFANREMETIRDNLSRRMHGLNLARDLIRIPEEEWRARGDWYEKPLDTEAFSSSSSNRNNNNDEFYRVYCKGLVSEERTNKGGKLALAGIGVAICDPVGNLILEVKKPLIGNGLNKGTAELKALMEGLTVALSMELKRVNVYCDYLPTFQYVIGRWSPRQPKISRLVDQILTLRRKFAYCHPVYIARNKVKHAFKFAREAIDSQIFKPAESSSGKSLYETCAVCLEDTDTSLMFPVDVCLHRYCFSCMRQHVEAKLLHGLLPKCPHEGCNSEINLESSRKFLTPKLIEMLVLRQREASIPATEKVYCPYPRCSALMSNKEISEFAENACGSQRSGARKCLKCHGLFCFICKVPWHRNMTCDVYKRLNPNPPAEDVRLKSLAARNLWKQCVKCKHMIELSEGCYHIICRCGHEFCYNCGLEWKNKKATCTCPLFDEDHVLYGERDDEEEDDDDDEDEDYYDDSDELSNSESDVY